MDVLTTSGTVKGQVDMPEAVFGQKEKPGQIWESVRSFLANQRQGNHSTKTRAEVSGTGKKPYRQKHTGRARHGSRRSPIFKGGGVVFGPRTRDHGYDLPKKARRQALLAALSARHADGAVTLVEDFDLAVPKTKEMAKLMTGLKLSGSVLMLLGPVPENVKRAGRNIPNLTMMPAQQVNAYAVLAHERIVVTETGLKSLVATWGSS